MNGFALLSRGLAIGGVFWGVVCLILTVMSPCAILCFLPGYALTYGYIHRAYFGMSRDSRILLWSCSAFIQGIWLMFAGLYALQIAIDRGFMSWVTGALIWWAASFLGSVAGIFMDRDEQLLEPCTCSPVTRMRHSQS